ncbi:hypothetical protein [Methermicoccus shengliensis]|uniref:Orotate phosphoribosyltransferase n=1 Tax=Methermicoccus shengliensis TaxID=660064 RepID=A0A832RVD8_9EURY|nr:hypothetical protein [Methermicoccus shengliensis]HIH69189.1 hypothetical protein [Methermicoccus shengliensis]
MMKALCDVCRARVAQSTCPMCGRRVCMVCMSEGGVCVLCLAGRMAP